MARSSRDDASEREGVEFIHEDDGSITARDKESGVASFGQSKAEALQALAEALALHEGDGESIDTPEEEREALQEMEIDPDEVAAAREENDELPDFMQ